MAKYSTVACSAKGGRGEEGWGVGSGGSRDSNNAEVKASRKTQVAHGGPAPRYGVRHQTLLVMQSRLNQRQVPYRRQKAGNRQKEKVQHGEASLHLADREPLRVPHAHVGLRRQKPTSQAPLSMPMKGRANKLPSQKITQLFDRPARRECHKTALVRRGIGPAHTWMAATPKALWMRGRMK
jgi:hypothetical protein